MITEKFILFTYSFQIELFLDLNRKIKMHYFLQNYAIALKLSNKELKSHHMLYFGFQK